MKFKKIESADIVNKGNIGKPDTPGVPTAEMQRILDELPREVIIPAFNELSAELDAAEIYSRVKSGDIKAMRVNLDNQLEVSKDGINFEATGSSGHLIMDKMGTMLPQRGRLQFNGEVTVADSAATNATIITGLKGDKGDKGEQGIQGVQGIQGIVGKVYMPILNDIGDISWQIVNDSGTIPAGRNIRGPQGIEGRQGIQGIQGLPGTNGTAGAKGDTGAQGPQGPQGNVGAAGTDGRNFTVHGRFDSLADLQNDHPTGKDGDAWTVGTIANNTVYVWDIRTKTSTGASLTPHWEDVGPIVGPMGPQGIQGIAGAKGDVGARGDKGDTGAQGIQGIQGPQGERGIQGVQGVRGAQGLPTVVNGKTGENIYITASDVGALAENGTAQSALKLGGQLPEYFQPKTDSTLATENKTVIGAINGIIDGTYTVGNTSMLGNVVSSEYLKMQKATTLNVSLSGSDTLGDGSAAKPYKTIQKAVDSLSKYLIGDVEIKVADGVYNENVSVKGFVGIGVLTIKSTAGDSVNPNDYDRCKLKWLHVTSCSARIAFLGFTLTTLNSTGWYGSLATIANCQHVDLRIKATVNTMGGESTLSAVNIQNSGAIFLNGNLIQNQRIGIFANQNSRVYILNTVVNNCTSSLCSDASIMSLSWASQIAGTLAKGEGGLITYGGGLFK